LNGRIDILKQIGIVISTDNNKTLVSVKRSTSCGDNCSSCSGSCKLLSHQVEVINNINAREGEWVELELEDSKILFAAFLIYIVPIIFFFIGYGISESIFRNSLIDIIIGLILSSIVYTYIKRYDKKHKKNNKYIPKIIRTIKVV
jgi:sigma-E factor negative regulatory protein RseC